MFESFSKDEENVFSQFFFTPDSDEDDERDGCVGSSGNSGNTAAAAAAPAATDTSARVGDIIRSVNDNCSIDCSAIRNEEDDDVDKHTETIYRSSSYPINITLLERLVLYHYCTTNVAVMTV
jgi:hypothetical protein